MTPSLPSAVLVMQISIAGIVVVPFTTIVAAVERLDPPVLSVALAVRV
jgi:hypothetical protein